MRMNVTMLVLAALVSATLSAGDAVARPLRHAAKVHKTHRIVAGSKSIRINDVGQVITTRTP